MRLPGLLHRLTALPVRGQVALGAAAPLMPEDLSYSQPTVKRAAFQTRVILSAAKDLLSAHAESPLTAEPTRMTAPAMVA